MKRKLLLSILSLICALTCAFGFAACGDNTPHSHSWSQSWERSETHHWHNCTAENCTVTDNSQKDGYTEHDFSNGNCVCGQPKPHTHIWSQSWEINDTHHWHNCTAENCTVTDNSQKGGYAEHDFSNGNCVCGQPKLTAGLTYVLNPDGKSYSVKGGGTAKDTEIYIPALYKGKPVTHISDNAFDARIRFTSVTIPDSVTSIGNRAFRDCVGLTSVTIGKGVTTIGENAFTRCNKLTSIKIPDSVTSIGSYAFDGCTGLTSVTIGKGVTSIGDDAFNGCSSLQYNEYDNAYYLGNASNPYVILIKAKDTSITNCTINSNTKIISSFAFYDCSGLTSITIPDSVTSIGRYAFRDCTSLMSVTIGNGVTSIGDYAFNGCSALTSVIIGNGVTSIGDTAFNGCSKLKYNEYDNAYYLGNASNPYVVLMKAKNMSIKNCTINSNTKYIYFNAFQQCGSLTSITIPDSVTTIGSWAFYGCRALTSITIPDSVTAIGDEAFSGCSALTSITIPDSVTSIGDYAFSGCSALTSVTIGSNVERIGEWAFQSCSALTSVTFTNTSGWWVSTSRTATSGTNVDVTDISQNASYFTSTYQSYYWKRG